jgi:hypothetical protein
LPNVNRQDSENEEALNCMAPHNKKAKNTNRCAYVRFEVFRAVTMKNGVFWESVN